MMKNTVIQVVIVGVLALLIGYFAGIFLPVQIGDKKSISYSSDAPSLGSEIDSFSYYYGLSIGQFLTKDLAQLDIKDGFATDKFMTGLASSLDGKEVVDQMIIQGFMQSFFMKKQADLQAKAEVQATENMEKGKTFLENNKNQPGVTTTGSGLQYQVISSGSGGISPANTDTVIVHYKGTLIDGTVFDSSIDRGEPAKFRLDNVIRGWTEGLQMMKVGDKWKFFIPSELAYGPQQTDAIGPNSTLIFEVELIDVIKEK
jgi:FKBP-type peptidyl-prolyl cis-trans isomerase